MLFTEALQELKEGKNISRLCWKEEDGYIVLLKGMKHAWKIITKPAPNAGNHIFSVEELGADDWIVYDEAKFAVKEENLMCDAA